MRLNIYTNKRNVNIQYTKDIWGGQLTQSLFFNFQITNFYYKKLIENCTIIIKLIC